MTPLSPHPDLELVWVNASPNGPIANDNKDPSLHHILRFPAGRVKTISRSSSPTESALVNDLSTHVNFPLAKVVSRDHATIEWLHNEPIVRDKGATHGTYVAHRQACFANNGTVHETEPSAPLLPVEGVLPLRHGDLIEFGKTCTRSNASYNPVRCYVRLVSAAPPTLSASFVPTKPFSLIDDPLDSESDIVSIDADSFRASATGPLDLQSTLATLSSMQTDIVDLTSDDDEEPHSPPSESSLESDGSELNGEDSDDGHFDSHSEESFDPFDHREMLWRREIEEVSLERAELNSEAIEARMKGEGYMKSYKTRCELTADSPNTSINSETSDLGNSKPDPSPAINTCDAEHDISGNASATNEEHKELANIAKLASPYPPIAAPTADLADKSEQPSPAEHSIVLTSVGVDMPSVTDQAPTKKRKIDAIQEAESAEDPGESDSGSVASSSSTTSESLSSSISTSSSLSPRKKSRITLLHHGGDKRQAPLRGRTIKKLVAKAMYATSLLSVGFLTGSLFTFKSMMNAAAAANAADKQ
ncbi:uncharacterized protein UTRI_00572 [Ustilago trichophora]|uniref:FHA domain-containing protein n=1 Tax=Ustilago trichophora TaxID=86804 RepID=A0A5C3DRU6_9BASI|nr:uncharacterized protein UTRI_00572 [Ustilago trichophora]